MRISFLAALILALAACSPPAGQDKAKTETAAPGLRAVAGDEIRLDAPILSVEDGGYPRFTVLAQTPQGELTLDLNAEAADLGGATPGSFAGKRATIYYRTTQERSLVDLRAGDQSLIEGTAAPTGPSVTGTLSGAEEVTGGDLPSTITVTDSAGTRTTFDYFVTPEIVAANGAQVTAFYTTGDVSHITLMRAN